jgi:hypothetical protein
MSRMELAAKPLLRGTFFGEETSWAQAEQLVVATWAFKTALMLDRSSVAARQMPADHFAYLWRERKPHPNVQILVGKYAQRPGESTTVAAIGVGRGAAWVEGSYRIPFSVGQVAFVVHGRAGTDLDGVNVNMSVRAASGLILPLWFALPRIWPPDRDVFPWPPNGYQLSSRIWPRFWKAR